MAERIEDLAGATLDRVDVDWRNGIVRITFLAAGSRPQACAVRALDFASVAVPRGGASRHVKAASHRGDVLEIEMESGERLRVESPSIFFDALSG